MDLNAFPDTVLRAVFDRVPLSDLVRHIPLVCHRWNSLQPSVLLSKKNMAFTLMIGEDAPRLLKGSNVLIMFEDELTNEDGSPMYPSPMDDPRLALTLTLSTLTSEQVDSLIDKLGGRKVSYLKLGFCMVSPHKLSGKLYHIGPPVADPTEIPLIIRLLEHWGPGLKTLKLHSSFSYFYSFEVNNEHALEALTVQLGELIGAVNSLPLLDHLTLDLHEDLIMTEQFDLPILSRLKEFYFYSNDDQLAPDDFIFRWLKLYAEPNDKLRSIGIENNGHTNEFLAQFGESTLAKRFTSLSRVTWNCSFHHFNLPPANLLQGGKFNDSNREQFLNIFTSQIKYSIKMKDLNLVELTRLLAPLHSLVQLDLHCYKPFTNFDTDPVDQIRPLPSVKVLLLSASTFAHNELGSKHWARMFPNLQILMLFHHTSGCTICGLQMDSSESEKVTVCVRQTLQPFKQQFRRTLKKVHYCRNRDYDNTKVFTLDTI